MCWEKLTDFQKIMVFIAAPSTIIIIIQMILLFIGFGGNDTFDTADDIDFDVADVPADGINNEGFSSLGGIRVFTLRGILAFLSVGGWLALALSYTMEAWLAVLLGILGGCIVAFLIALAFHYSLKLQASGNINYKKAINHNATVYLRIPAQQKGKGKVNLTLQDRFVEVEAVTDNAEIIQTGVPVKIIGLADENTVIVETIIESDKNL